jgi:8-oxo-dGTP pyrophosphatase MutT (NUDIX family)
MNSLFTDNLAFKLPVSIKSILFHDNKYLLRKNERDEWELLGGKLEKNEDPAACLIREVWEEANIDVEIHSLIDVWIYQPAFSVDVLIITFACTIKNLKLPVISPEGSELAWFSLKEIETIEIPAGYKNSIKAYEAKCSKSFG